MSQILREVEPQGVSSQLLQNRVRYNRFKKGRTIEKIMKMIRLDPEKQNRSSIAMTRNGETLSCVPNVMTMSAGLG